MGFWWCCDVGDVLPLSEVVGGEVAVTSVVFSVDCRFGMDCVGWGFGDGVGLFVGLGLGMCLPDNWSCSFKLLDC